MYRNSVKFSIATWMLLLGALGLSSCAQEIVAPVTASTDKDDNNDGVEDSVMVVTGRIGLDWGMPEFKSRGYMFSGLLQFTEALDPLSLSQTGRNFCFENNASCVRAQESVRWEIQNNPVAIQAFKLNVASNTGNAFTLQAASVTTAELRVNGGDGRFVFSNRVTRELVSGTTCQLDSSNPYNVGFAPGVLGSERILTGLYLYDEPGTNPNATLLEQAHITSARVKYSGLKPVASSLQNEPYAFSFVPTESAATADFGKQDFIDAPESGAGVVATEWFGLDEAYATQNSIPRYQNHVIIGFCIQSTKTGASFTRPGLWGSKIRTYLPRLFIKEGS